MAKLTLEHAEVNFRNVFDANPDPIVISSVADGRIVLVNREFERASGYSKDEALGRTSIELKLWPDPDERERCAQIIKTGGELRNFDMTLQMKDGNRRPYLLSVSAVLFNDEPCNMTVARDVTELRRIESDLATAREALALEVRTLEHTQHRLQQTEGELRGALSASPETVVIFRRSDLVVRGIFGRSTPGLAESGIREGEPPTAEFREANPAFTAVLHRAVLSGIPPEMIFEYKASSNSEATAFLTHFAAIEFAGEPCIITSARDISEQKLIQRRLQESERRLIEEAAARERSEVKFRTIVDANVDILVINDWKTGQYVEINDECIRALGYSREDLIGRTDQEVGIWPAESLSAYIALLRQHRQVRGFEATLRRKDGQYVPCLNSAVVTELAGRKCLITMSRDISALKEAERKLRESESTLRTVIESSPDSITINRAADGTYIAANHGFVRMSGFSLEETLGRSARELGLWAESAELKEFLRRLRADSVVPGFAWSARRKTGEITSALTSASLMELGGEQCVITITRDITEIKQTELELMAAREAALAASQAKSEFLSSMSHEIRTPMNAIVGMTELIGQGGLADEQRRYLDIVKTNCDSLLSLINDILDLAKIESGRMTLDYIAFDIVELSDKVAEMMAVRAHEKGIELAVRVAPEVPRNIIGDALRLRQILVNLVGNAIKFTERGCVSLEVTCVEGPHSTSERNHGKQRPVSLQFNVTDTGIGIPSDKFGLIFSSFEQADSSTTRQYGGSGLGLAIVKRLVGLFGGEISVQSELGVGSCFSFRIVCVAADSVSGAVLPAVPGLQGARILVVGEAQINRFIVRELLAPLGAEVEEAKSYEEAVALSSRTTDSGRPYRLLIVDCAKDGGDFVTKITELRELYEKEQNPLPAILMFSSDDLPSKLARMRGIEISAYLVKPLRRRDLIRAVKRAFGEIEELPPQLEIQRRITPGKLPPMRVLLAEDSPVNRLLIREYLAATPLTLDEAENGEIAHEKFASGRYDLVIMDMRMPVMDGYAATRAIREWERLNDASRTPVIALTASALKTDVDRCLEAGCDQHLSKPIKLKDLLEAIAVAVPTVHAGA
jgi:PAS domain S-box-containing protein